MQLLRDQFQRLPRVLRELIIYGFCGCASLVIFLITVVVCELIMPGYVSSDLPDAVRARHLMHFHLIAFFPSNIFAWWSNRTFVFRRSERKHGLKREVGTFFFIAAISFILSLFVPTWLIRSYGISNSVATLTLAFLSALWNFILRRIFVFGASAV